MGQACPKMRGNGTYMPQSLHDFIVTITQSFVLEDNLSPTPLCVQKLADTISQNFFDYLSLSKLPIGI